MAKIDFSLIEGYDSMSDAEKLTALSELDIPDTSDELEKLKADAKRSKDLIDKYTSEISALKKSKSEGLSEAEKKTQEYEDALKDLQGKYDGLLRSSALDTNTARGVALGCDDALASDIATGLADGDAELFYASLAKFKQVIEKAVKAELVKSTPKPDTKGGATQTLTREEILKIKDPTERQRQIAENMDLFTKEN